MSVVDFTDLRFSSVIPQPVEYGRVQRPDVGEAFRTDRLGNRWAMQFQTPPMAVEPDGRRWQAKFDDAARLGGLFRIVQPDFGVGAPGSNAAVAADTASGRTIPLAGLTPRYAIRAGQWISIIVDGRRYLDRVMEQVIAGSDGTASVRVKNLIRKPLSEDDVVEIAEPKIEGTIEMQSPPAWGGDRMTQFAFTVIEDA